VKTSWREVLHDCLALAKPIGNERVERAAAWNRVLAEEVIADRGYPSGDLSMMDGYALGADTCETYRVEGENTPGNGRGVPLKEGAARRIFTGAELPSGATRVIPQENVRREGDGISVITWPDSEFIRPRGQEAKSGDGVLSKGVLIGPVELAVLATVGRHEVEVFKRPNVVRLATGDEIVSPDEPLPEGKIRDSNGDLIDGLLRHLGVHASTKNHCSDDRDLMFTRVAALAKQADFLLISGGASVGEHDFARPALEAAGFTFLAHGLHVRPGRPVGIAHRGEQWAFALPGNPLSHLVVLRLLVIPLLRACCGETDVEPKLIRGVLDAELEREIPKRDTFWPAIISLHDGQLRARPGRFLASGDLIGAARVNGFISLPMNQPVPGKGEAIDILPLSPTFP
jgi:molybdopterin molybdotransferase